MGKTAETHRLQTIAGEGGKILLSFWETLSGHSGIKAHNTNTPCFQEHSCWVTWASSQAQNQWLATEINEWEKMDT